MMSEVRFPLVLSAVLILVAGACSDEEGVGDTADDPAGSTVSVAVNPDAAPVDGAYFRFVEVGVGNDGYVTLENYSGVDHSLDAYFLCQGDACVDLPDVIVTTDQSVRVATVAGSGVDDVVMTDAEIGVLRPLDGELALYRSSDLSADTLVAYYQWGSDPHDITDDAIEASLWVEGAYGPTGEEAVRLWLDPGTGLWLWDAAE